MKKYARALYRLAALAMCLILLTPVADICAQAASSGRRLTLMIYMTGSDLESSGGLASRDIQEMLLAHDDPENVSVLILIGGAKEWQNDFPSDRSVIYELVNGRPVPVWEGELMNMGDPATLTWLLDFGYGNYPADDYALILWDHGGGPLDGVCFDELHNSGFSKDRLEMTELGAALAASPCAAEPLEWIGFDACLMASIETAFICAPYATYMIASQEVEPGTGWDYSFLHGIASDPSGAVTGIRIVDTYYASFSGMYDDLYITLSCIDLRKIGAVETAMDGMFAGLDDVLDENSFSILSNLRRDARSIARASTGSEYDLIDLYHMTQLYSAQLPGDAAVLMDAVDDAVIYHRSNIPDTNGLSIYYPYYNKDYYSYSWQYDYPKLGFSDGYTSYLRDYATIWLGESMTRWSGMQTTSHEPAAETGDSVFTMELTDEQLSNFAGAELYVMSYDDSHDIYSFVYSTGDTSLEGNTVSAVYNNTALYVLDENGTPITGALEYKVVEDTYLLRAVLCENDDLYTGETLPVYLQCRLNEDTRELEVVGIIDLSKEEEELTSGKQSITLDPETWKSIYIAKYPVLLTHGDDGELLPFPQWADSSWIFAYTISNEKPWTIKFVEENYITEPFKTMFVVTDTQGNCYASGLTDLANENLTPVDIEGRTVLENEYVKVELTGASLSTAGYDPGLVLNFKVTNTSEISLRLNTEHFLIGDLALDIYSPICDSIAPGETRDCSMIIYSYQLEAANIYEVPNLSFDLLLYDDASFDVLTNHRVIIDSTIDITPLTGGGTPSPEPDTVPEPGKLNMDLYDVTVSDDGSVSGTLRIVNLAGKEYDTIISRGVVNGYAVDDIMLQSVWVPDGATIYIPITIAAERIQDQWSLGAMPFIDRPFDYWDIESVESLRLLVYNADYEYEYIDVRLAQPIALTGVEPVDRHEELLTDSDVFTVSRTGEMLIDYPYEGSIKVCDVLIFRNLYSGDLAVSIDDIRLNGLEVPGSGSTDLEDFVLISYSPLVIREDVTTRFLLGIDVTELDPATELSEYSFTVVCYDPAEPDTILLSEEITVHLPAGTTVESLMAQ